GSIACHRCGVRLCRTLSARSWDPMMTERLRRRFRTEIISSLDHTRPPFPGGISTSGIGEDARQCAAGRADQIASTAPRDAATATAAETTRPPHVGGGVDGGGD